MTNSLWRERHYKAHWRFVQFSRRWLPILIMLSPVLMTAFALLILVLFLGATRLLTFLGLKDWILFVWGVGMVVAFPLGFFLAVRVGRFLVGRSEKN